MSYFLRNGGKLMHIEYWVCDYCKKEIERDEKKKYATPEMGYPFIPKERRKKTFSFCMFSKIL